MTIVFFEFRLEALEQGERVGSATGKAGQNALVVQASHLARRTLQHDITKGDLTVAAQRNLLAATDRQNGCSMHFLFHDLSDCNSRSSMDVVWCGVRTWWSRVGRRTAARNRVGRRC